LGAKGNFHYPLVEKLDTYTGILLGYNVVSSNGPEQEPRMIILLHQAVFNGRGLSVEDTISRKLLQ